MKHIQVLHIWSWGHGWTAAWAATCRWKTQMGSAVFNHHMPVLIVLLALGDIPHQLHYCSSLTLLLCNPVFYMVKFEASFDLLSQIVSGFVLYFIH